MFYYFLLDNKSDFNQLKMDVINILSTRNNFLHKYHEDESIICCEGFTVTMKEGGRHVSFRSEDYGMKFRFWFNFDIISSYTGWAYELMNLIGNILKSYDGDCVLEANGDTPIVMRKDNIVIVDDKKLMGTQKFPFDGLGLQYQEGDLVQV